MKQERLLSNRGVRKVVAVQATTTVQLERVLLSFLNRGFFGRMKWLLFGR